MAVSAPAITPPAQPVSGRRSWLATRRRQVIAAVVVASALGFLAFQGLTNATEYFLTADQAVAQRATLGTSQFRVEGTVSPGVRHDASGTEFDIYANGATIHVVDPDQPPQLFKVAIPVVLVGHWQGADFAANQIMVKHTADYTEAHPDRLKSQLPANAVKSSP